MTPRTFGVHALAASLLAGWALVAAGPAPAPQAGDPPAWTADDCAACHEDVVASLAGRPHAAPTGWTADNACAACHGDPTAHLESAGDVAMTSLVTADLATVVDTCRTCHGDTHPRFLSSQHARAGVACTSCHTVHGELAPGAAGRAMLPALERGSAGRIDGISAFCADCHADVAHDFELNERHRLQEGILTCTSCHDPHAPATRTVLGGFTQDTCIDCHTDRGGPFVFEHGSVKVEGCVACHTPHGSVNRHLLTFQSTGELCLSCHAVVPAFHVAGSPTRFNLDTNCTNCHSSIHGSNLDPFFLK